MPNFKLAARVLSKTPFVTAVAVLSLALGIGSNAAIFSLFDLTLLRPLPVNRPGELVNLAAPGPNPGSHSCNLAGDCDTIFTYPMFRDLQRVQRVFTDIGAHFMFGTNLAFRNHTVNGDGVFVSGSYFPMLGIQPALGRLLTSQDDRSVGQSPVAVLAYDYWQTHFNGDATVVGQPLVVNGQPLTIVGVAPKDFRGTTLGGNPLVFVPITLRGLLNPTFDGFTDRSHYWIYLFGRLRPGVSIDQARTALNLQYHAIVNDVEAPLQKALSAETLKQFRAKTLRMEAGGGGQSRVHQEAQAPMTMLLGVTGLVLLIACANIANLLLARAATRAAEMSVRLSLGAGRGQLVSQLLAESCLLAVCGGLAGVVFGRWTLDVVVSLLPAEVVAGLPMGLDGRALMYTAALTFATALLFGLFPALHATRPNLTACLKGQAGQPAGARGAAMLRKSLATAQIALSMMLLVAAGLFIKSLANVSRADLGMKVDDLVTFTVSPRLNGYKPEASRALFERLEDDLAALPGVTGVTAASVPLIGGSNWVLGVSVEGFHAGPDTDVDSDVNAIAPGYFDTLGVRLLAGRSFTRADALGSPKVAIVNEEFARKFNLGKDAVGRKMAATGAPGAKLDMEIIGLMQNTKYSDVTRKIRPMFVQPYRQDPRAGALTFYIRSSLDAGQLLPTIRKTVSRLDPNLPVQDLKTMPQQVRENVFLDRMIAVLSTGFGVLATLLAAVGLYGVLAYTVTQRTREIGLRMALGADARRVRGMVLRYVAWMTLVGAPIGLAAAGALGRQAEAMLFEMKGFDPIVFGGAAVVLTLVAFAAGLLPALRASRIDPMRALRYE